MANLKTHLTVAAMGSGLLATACIGADVHDKHEILALLVVGTIGGLLPDIDLDHSGPAKVMFTVVALVFAFMVAFNRAPSSSIVELWAAWGLSYGVVRYVAWRTFSRLTVHRGIFHSLVAAFFFWFLGTALSYHLFDLQPLFAWSIGFFIFFSYVIHLFLDELFSVDLLNTRLKKSFGTALKIADFKNARTSLSMAGAALILFFATPSLAPFAGWFTDSQTYTNIFQRLLP